jgi:succinate-acetate transporter protein
MQKTAEQHVKIVTADPSGIGLFGLAMATLVACTMKLGWTSGASLVIPWALFLGGAAQIFAGVIDAKKNNIFGATVFSAYGLFWLGLSVSLLIQMGALGETLALAADPNQLGAAYLGYFIFSVFMTIGSFETNKNLIIIFIFIDLLFLGLFLSTFGIAEHAMHSLAAWSELGIAVFSFYGCIATVLNTHFGRVFLPLGKPLGIFKRPCAE